jgi:hypothetical protein
MRHHQKLTKIKAWNFETSKAESSNPFLGWTSAQSLVIFVSFSRVYQWQHCLAPITPNMDGIKSEPGYPSSHKQLSVLTLSDAGKNAH